MFIVVVARGIPGDSDPLYGQFEFDQAKALKQIGHQVVVVALDLRSVRRLRPWGIKSTTSQGLPVISVSIPLGNIGSKLTADALAVAWRGAYRVVERRFGAPDVVHAHFARLGYAVACDKRRNYKLVITEHSSKYGYEGLNQAESEIAKDAYENSDQVLAVSSSLANVLNTNYGISAQVVFDVVDPEEFAWRPVPSSQIKDFISVGNLLSRKRFDLLIEAFKKAKLASGTRLTIVGSGEEQAKLEALADDDERIIFTGGLNRREIAGLHSNCGGFVFFSQHETFGVVLIEAMAAGLPVLSTKCGGPSDFVTPDVGMLVPNELNIDQAAEALEIFQKNMSNIDRQHVRQVSIEKFSPQTIASELESIYRKITAS